MAIKQLVQLVLENYFAFSGWSISGLGFLRLNLPDGRRLHVWDNHLQIPGVTMLHTHPWDLESYVVAGHLDNRRFIESSGGLTHYRACIECGPEAVPQNKVIVCLAELPMERLGEGFSYHQRADEIHMTEPISGTVTLIDRVRSGKGNKEANVYWPCEFPSGRDGVGFVSAQQRVASLEEVNAVVNRSLRNWFWKE